jgi:misacylated tRNA(Ala) deacylase
MTEALYYVDAYMKRFNATVVERSDHAIVLDRSAFYPGGGGQPCDQGMLLRDDGTIAVSRVRKRDGKAWHILDGVVPEVGEEIELELDWDLRFQLMRTHTAMHILCGVIWRDYGASVTGGKMEPLKGRMDFEFESMQRELVDEIEQKINDAMNQGYEIRTEIVAREEAFKIPDLIRTKINLLPKGISRVRTVNIVGLDLQADGGTHVANTNEVGPIRIVDYKSKGAINKRLVVALEA